MPTALLQTLTRSRPTLATAADACRLFEAGFAGATVERLQVALLDHDRRLLALYRIDGLAHDAVVLPIRAIIAHALALDAAALVLAHNHPRGDPAPSAADLLATRALARAAGPLAIRLLDHLVFGASRCTSFRALGLL